RRLAAAELVEHEQRWLTELAPGLPLPIPAPVRVGRPTSFYPWSWSVLPWFDGVPAGIDPALDGAMVADQLGRFLAALHRPAPPEAPTNPHRGVPLENRQASFVDRVEALAGADGHPGVLDRKATLDRWTACVEATPWDGPPLWVHGDLHSHNLLSADGRLSAVIDFGDITAGDPATDLAAAWSILDPSDWPAFRAAATTDERPIDDAMWLRAEGNALAVGVAVLANSNDNPAMAAMARRTLGPLVLDRTDDGTDHRADHGADDRNRAAGPE
ncbi:MAG: aminoglycoside phosphotransferase family protein, partial [Actinomycetota bacterium]